MTTLCGALVRRRIALLSIVWCACFSSACGSEQLDLRPPYFAAGTDVIDFGAVEVGERVEQTLYIVNKGDKTLSLAEPQGNTLGGIFTVLVPNSDIEPQEDVVVRVVFQPLGVSDYETSLTFVNDSANQPLFTLTLRGLGRLTDPCADLTCASPPRSACLDADTSRYYPPFGSCDVGRCVYDAVDMACHEGCDLDTGRCAEDACAGIACQTPPNSCFGATGVCVQGACLYTALSSVACNDQDACTLNDTCQEGTCRGTPKRCDAPPASVCRDTHVMVVYDPAGICGANGACNYVPRDMTCEFGCQNGSCQGDPCAGGCDDGNPCTRDSCAGAAGCVHDSNDGASCTAGSERCPMGQCVGTRCMSVPDISCTAEYDIDLCAEAYVAGICAANGDCNVTQAPPQFTCPGCPGLCLQCYFIQLCIPL